MIAEWKISYVKGVNHCQCLSLAGSSGVEQDVMNIIDVGTADGTGNDIFSAEIQHNGGSDGDGYNCNASNVVSSLSQTERFEDVILENLNNELRVLYFLCSVIKSNS